MHPTPASADVCTTLPPGNLPMRDLLAPCKDTELLWLTSHCGRVTLSLYRQPPCQHPLVPIGAWDGHEKRTDSNGEAWIRQDRNAYYVVDNFGFLARVQKQGGAA